MNYLENMVPDIKDAFIAYITGIVEMKNEREIWWEDRLNEKITIIFCNNGIDQVQVKKYESDYIKKYIFKNKMLIRKNLRYIDMKAGYDEHYEDGHLHGTSIDWNKNGITVKQLWHYGLLVEDIRYE